jgi:hypothetical protein
VLIPVILTSEDRNRETKIWIKAMPTHNLDEEVLADKQDHEFVEFLLKKALTKVQSEKKQVVQLKIRSARLKLHSTHCYVWVKTKKK